jgi:hypothetical protein
MKRHDDNKDSKIIDPANQRDVNEDPLTAREFSR